MLAIVGESGSGKTVTARSHPRACCPRRRPARGAVLLTGKDGIRRTTSSRCRSSLARSAAATPPWCSRSRRPRSTRSTRWAGRSPRACARTARYSRSKEATAPRRSTSSARSASPTRSTGSTTTRTSSPAGRSSASSSRWRWSSTPGLIVADEPTTALDVTVQAEILDLLRALPRRVRHRDRADHPQHGRGRRPRRPGRGHVPGRRSSRRPTSRTLFAAPQDDYTKQLLAAVPHLGQATRASRAGMPDARTRAASGAGRRGARTCASSTPAGCGSPASPPSTASASRSARARCSAWSASRGSRQDHDRPGHRRADQGHRRLAAGARRRDERSQGAHVPAAPQARSASSSRTRRPASTRC